MYETLIKINEIMDAKKVMFITEISGDDGTGFDRDCVPITLLKKDRLKIADKMHNKKLKVYGQKYSTRFLPLSIFITRLEYPKR
jgi:hypothetical protein